MAYIYAHVCQQNCYVAKIFRHSDYTERIFMLNKVSCKVMTNVLQCKVSKDLDQFDIYYKQTIKLCQGESTVSYTESETT